MKSFAEISLMSHTEVTSTYVIPIVSQAKCIFTNYVGAHGKPHLHILSYLPTPLHNMIILTFTQYVSLCSESSSKPFTTTFECLQEYWLGDEIECQYTVTNNHNNDYHVLKRFTPLEGMQSSFVSISRNGEVIPYDGIMIKRSFPPKDEEYLLLKAGSKHVLTIDLSLAYAIYETGQYTVTANIPLYYHRALHGATFEDAKQEFEPTVLTFQVHEGKSPRLTLGDFHRQRAAHPIGVQQAPNA